MASRHLLFRILYGIGFTPWDGHPQSAMVRQLVEGTDLQPPGSALDVGCGTGNTSIYLAQHGWQVTGVDFTPKALDKARAKARAAGAAVDFIHADVTHLSQAGISGPFELIVDNGCLHGMSDHDRDLYIQEITAAATPGARLTVAGFTRGGGVGPVGIDQGEIERRFTPAWTLLSAADERIVPQGRLAGKVPARLEARSYLLQRNV
jgi:2-polyprenyl-3-methyl-5-hydroxy-6-metoxy-1,4-benzoquinol methylase